MDFEEHNSRVENAIKRLVENLSLGLLLEQNEIGAQIGAAVGLSGHATIHQSALGPWIEVIPGLRCGFTERFPLESKASRLPRCSK